MLFQREILPLTTVLTISISEAVLLFQNVGASKPNIRSLDDLMHCAKALHSLGPQYILLKGGQLPLNGNLKVPNYDIDKRVIVDVLSDGTDVRLFKTSFVVTGLPQGTRYALARTLSTSEAMVSQTNDRPQLQSLRISPLGTTYH